MSNDFLLGYVLEFTDGGPPEVEVLHRGTLESCKELSDLLPAIAYSGSRPWIGAWMRIVPAPVPEETETDRECEG